MRRGSPPPKMLSLISPGVTKKKKKNIDGGDLLVQTMTNKPPQNITGASV